MDETTSADLCSGPARNSVTYLTRFFRKSSFIRRVTLQVSNTNSKILRFIVVGLSSTSCKALSKTLKGITNY